MPYYISVNNVQQGPMEEADIRDKVSKGEIPVQNSLFWKEGMPTWAPLSQLVGSVPPPLTPAAAPAPMPTPPLTPAAAPAPMPTPPLTPAAAPAPVPTPPYPAQQVPPQPYPAVQAPVYGQQAPEYNPINAFVSAMKRYAMFTGRASRSEYWFFTLSSFILLWIPFVEVVWVLAGIIPSFAIAIRRMHDVGKSGWFCIIPIYSIVLCCMPSEGPNQYGPGPLPPER